MLQIMLGYKMRRNWRTDTKLQQLRVVDILSLLCVDCCVCYVFVINLSTSSTAEADQFQDQLRVELWSSYTHICFQLNEVFTSTELGHASVFQQDIP